jgi:pilus assembly protein CpaC
VLAGLAALAGMIGGSALAQPPAPPAPPGPSEAKVDKATGALIVPLGGSVRYTPSKTKLIVDTFIANEEVLAVRPDPTDPKVLVLTGRAPGATQITVTFEDKTRATYDVLVQPDYDLLRQVIRRAAPTASVDVIPGVGNTIILTGYVTNLEDVDTILAVARGSGTVINALRVGGAQHVLIDVTVAQVDRSELRERGVSFGIQGTEIGFSSVLGGLGISTVTAGAGGAGVVGGGITPGANANIVVGIVPAGFTGALRALKTEGLAKFLSEPKVITQSGRPAILRAGGQQAILGPSSGVNGPGVVLEEIGTTLAVLPIVFGNGKIYLDVQPTFRSVNNGRGLTTAFGFTPGFNESSVQSSVLLESGQTYAIGGLLETEIQNTTQKVPYLGELPWVGFAFSNVVSQERETELLILVTPRLVDALDCAQVPKRVPGKETRQPDDYELFIESLIEAPRGTRKIWDGKCYRPAYLCSETASQFPCYGPHCPGGAIGLGGCATGTCGAPGLGGVVVGGSSGKAPAMELPAIPTPVQPAGGEMPPKP